MGGLPEYALDAEWKKWEASIDEALKSGLSVEDLEYRSVAPIHALAASGYDAHFCAPLMATAYAIEGEAALARNNLNHASHCVDRGLYWSSPAMLMSNPNDRFIERARTGGLGKAFRRELAKDKVAELLMKLAPEEGWASTTAAIVALVAELTKKYSSFIEECHLKTDNLPRTIDEWIQVNPERFPHRIKSKP